jgi:hypothetical protein
MQQLTILERNTTASLLREGCYVDEQEQAYRYEYRFETAYDYWYGFSNYYFTIGQKVEGVLAEKEESEPFTSALVFQRKLKKGYREIKFKSS